MGTALQAMLAVPAAPEQAQAPENVELYLLDDAATAKANAMHLGCTGPTNILSFPGGPGIPGALLLSLDTLQRECLLYGQDPGEHALRLLAHGMAHLCGLDHSEQMDAVSDYFMVVAAEAVA